MDLCCYLPATNGSVLRTWFDFGILKFKVILRQGISKFPPGQQVKQTTNLYML